jgi:hypothetical protein
MKLAIVGAFLGLALFLPQAAGATTLVQGNFGGKVNAGSSAVRAPFNVASTGIVQGMTLNGSAVFDSDVVPASGLALVSFAGLTDPSDAFEFNIGSLHFDLGTATTGSAGITPAILFNNGAFAGLNYVSDFLYSDGLTYQLRFNSLNFTVRQVDPVTGFNSNSTINITGKLDLGGFASQSPYVEGPPGGAGVPEPSTWALMIVGLGGAGAMLRRRRALAVAA